MRCPQVGGAYSISGWIAFMPARQHFSHLGGVAEYVTTAMHLRRFQQIIPQLFEVQPQVSPEHALHHDQMSRIINVMFRQQAAGERVCVWMPADIAMCPVLLIPEAATAPSAHRH